MCKKAEMEGKFWIKENIFEVEESYSFNMDMKDIKEVRKIILTHFDYIVDEWNKYNQKKKVVMPSLIEVQGGVMNFL